MLHPKLYKKDTKGKARFWQVETDEAGGYRTHAGELLGKTVTSEWTFVKPKNVGRSNETDVVEQCRLEVAALYTKKLDKHYVTTVAEVDAPRKYFEVMLAQVYDEKTKKGMFAGRDQDMWSQPKLDGIRGPTTKDGSFSRDGNEFITVKFISEMLAPIFADYPDLVFDGELYNHELRDDFNEIISTIKREKPSEADYAKARELAQLHVYDMYDPNYPDELFHERHLRMRVLLRGGYMYDRWIDYGIDPNVIKVVQTDHVESFEELDEKYDEYLEAGYEGQMIRFDRAYEHKRTKMLLKRKELMTEEFEIIRIEEGKGNWAGYAKRIFVRLKDGQENKGGMKGTQAFLRQVLLEAHEYVGGTATMEFQGYTPDKKLRFPRAARLYKGKRDD